ncbi:hypothetical protein ABIC83_002887 [Roseateles asaccharophilus]|uniref:hypothetical protein n=1 Tax=Roseateles asaccharophilus TaxID=582607 RepID=UPI0038368A50
MPIAQAAIPKDFKNLWRVAGWVDEHEHATKVCKVLGYEQDGEGADLVRVEFVEPKGIPGALIHPHLLLPA